MPDWLATAVTAAVLGFGSALILARRNTRAERSEELRQKRIDVYTGFCAGLVEYRRAQLHRWHVGDQIVRSHPGPELSREQASEIVESQRPEVAEDVRACRAAAWSHFYAVRMITEDHALIEQAREALDSAKAMKHGTNADVLRSQSDVVHALVDAFAERASIPVMAAKQRPLTPAPLPRISRP